MKNLHSTKMRLVISGITSVIAIITIVLAPADLNKNTEIKDKKEFSIDRAEDQEKFIEAFSGSFKIDGK